MAGCISAQLPRAAVDTDSDSDSEGLRPRLPQQQVIHSGHFMVSSPHNDDRHRGKEPERPDIAPAGSIDPTLTRLFECMSLAYSGKLVSPKWKNFKGLRLLWRDKIRLNNAIWRAWYLQYVEKRKTPVCGFVTPLEGSEADDHRKPEAVVLEGNYWKRRIEVVMKEYNKWRIYYKKRLRKLHQDGKPLQEQKGAPSWRGSELFTGRSLMEEVRGNEDDMLYDLDYFLTDISDTLFTTTHGLPPSHQYPDFDYVGNADMIQPELATLQPSLDDFMDISDFFSGPRPLPSPQSPLSFQESHCYSTFSEGTNSHPQSAIACHRVPQPHSTYVSRSDSCFPSSGFSSAYGTTVVPCMPSSTETKPLSHYPEPSDRYTTDSFPSAGSLSIHCITSNLVVEDQDMLFPPVTCPKHHYTSVTTDTTILNQSSSPSIHADVYPLYAEPSTNIDMSHVFPMPKVHAQNSANKLRRPSADKATRPLPCVIQPRISAAKPDSAAQMPSGGPNGLNSTTAGRSDSMSFSGVTVPVVPPIPSSSTRSTLGFPSPPPAIFLSPVLCSPNENNTSGATNLESPPLLPKTERLSPTSGCGDDRKDSLTVPFPRAASCWSRPSSRKVESRRITHISAEQKRRCNIKLGFDTLHSLVTTLHGQHTNKLSKATTLQKTAAYICKLQQERTQLQEESQHLRRQVQELSDSISLCQQQLPASGVPITHQRFQHMRQMFQSYVQSRTLQNWKFWLPPYPSSI
ncbi:carbohydrate-responsive element-binding protein isoform X2 [Pseudophryne corroboree]|uniref:carbohydrate-responsive element-binding protein isoform X2 n=1 Tax=Pseudophryne corroboree TaxID=495146 RepID=UPI0030815A17